MEEAEGPELSVKFLTTRILALNFAAIHVGPDIISWHTCDAEIYQFCGQTSSLVCFEFKLQPDTPD